MFTDVGTLLVFFARAFYLVAVCDGLKAGKDGKAAVGERKRRVELSPAVRHRGADTALVGLALIASDHPIV
jgi:hypothetical protein